MRTRFFSVMILAAVFVVLTACSSAPTDKPEGQKDLAVNWLEENQRATQIQSIKRQFERLKSISNKGFATSAKGSGQACGFYDHYSDLRRLQGQHEFIGVRDTDDFSANLATATMEAAKRAAEVGYADMKAGKRLDCGGEERGEHYFIAELANLINDYGDPNADPQVARVAYLRAVKPLIQKALTRRNNEEELEVDTSELEDLVREAVEVWHFTMAELEISPATAKKFNF